MNFLNKKVSWSVWEFSYLKLAMASIGIILGVYFTEFWRPFLLVLWIIFIVTVVIATTKWIKGLQK